MSTTAKELLDIMSSRQSMQIYGTTNPSEEAKRFTNELVQKLKALSPLESIEIEIDENKGTKYIQKSSGEVLAEHYEY